ncbi:MAG TPA: zinc ribbon domain-containing protein [Candidatus Limnocylindrales bacterium]|nr:zinc ribbon domain-containing protein [Candidatus Limnocylindrales bacterium]
MLCTFCGTDNRPEYKFCGSCGVRLERRQAERRSRQSGSTKCAGCGHVNEPGMKFCGMCGTRGDRRMEERRGTGDAARAAAIANAQLPPPEAKGRATTQVAEPPELSDEVPVALPRRGEPAIFRNEPPRNERTESVSSEIRKESGNGGRISGPSFLGLNSQPDNNEGVEYLLEDEPSGSGLRKVLLLLVLAAILGLLFVQWRSSFKASPKPPAPAKSDPSTPANAPQGNNQPSDPVVPAVTEAPKTAASGTNAVTTGAASEVKAPRTEPTALETTSPSPLATSSDEGTTSAKTTTEKALPDSDGKEAEDARIPDYKPSAALVRAQQFIRGTGGVQQNCEQGMLYLRAATDKSDPGAAIQMAALYSSGLCVRQDRVMAYRWFNSAHELQPANMWIQKNMDQLWTQMSSQERRLAGY